MIQFPNNRRGNHVGRETGMDTGGVSFPISWWHDVFDWAAASVRVS